MNCKLYMSLDVYHGLISHGYYQSVLDELQRDYETFEIIFTQ